MTDEPEQIGNDVEDLRRRSEQLAARSLANPRPVRIVSDDDEVPAEYYAQQARARWERFAPPRFHDVMLNWPGFSESNRSEFAGWVERTDATNLLLLGPVGTGKTGGALAAAKARIANGADALYRPAILALQELRPGGPDDAFDRLSRVGLLVLDDVGAERATEWTVEQLAGIIDVRWQWERPTIVTSNLEPDPLEEWIGPRAFSRLVGSGSVVLRLAGKDRRRGR